MNPGKHQPNNNVAIAAPELPEVQKLREKFIEIAKITDPLSREYKFALLEKEAEKQGLSPESYRRLFEVYTQQNEYIPQYPQKIWNLIHWLIWFYKIPKKLKIILFKKGIFQLLQKGILVSLALSIFRYFWEAPQREKQAQYQAWTVITSASQQPGNGGRIAALEDLNKYGVMLWQIDLTNANLSGINLENANLAESNFTNALLACSIQRCSNLSKANLYKTNFQDANLIDANLQEANLMEAKLQEAKFLNAKLSKVRLFKANLESADFQEADLQNADLEDANLTKANLQQANLENAILTGAKFQASNLEQANLKSAKICTKESVNITSPKTITCANFIGAKNLKSEQITVAINWQNGCYDSALRQQLKLPPDNPKHCQ